MKLLIQLVREILHLSGKSQGISNTYGRGNHDVERMNIPQINQNSTKVPLQTTHSKLPPPEPPFRKKTPFSTTMASKTHGESEPSNSELTKLESSGLSRRKPSDKLCLFHGTKTHTLNECNKFRELTFAERKDFFKKNKLCFKCMSANKHNAGNLRPSSPSLQRLPQETLDSSSCRANTETKHKPSNPNQ